LGSLLAKHAGRVESHRTAHWPRYGQTASKENGERNSQKHDWVLCRSLKNYGGEYSTGGNPEQNSSQGSRPEQDQHTAQRDGEDFFCLRAQRNRLLTV
jgi:hypothetical protein